MGEMKRFFSLMMAVILLMCAAVPAAAEEGAEIISPSARINFRSSAQNTKNVGNNGMGGLLTDVAIVDENGKDVTSGPVEVGQKYTFKFDFEEDGENKQFVEGKLTYRFPEGLTFENVARQPVKDSAGNIVGYYEIANNELTFTPRYTTIDGRQYYDERTDEHPYSFIDVTNASLGFDFKGEFKNASEGENSSFEFGAGKTITIKVNPENKESKAEVVKTSEKAVQGGRQGIAYAIDVNVSGTDDPTILKVWDAPGGNNKSVLDWSALLGDDWTNQFEVVRVSADGTTETVVDGADYTLTRNTNNGEYTGFELEFDENVVKTGDHYRIRYFVPIDEAELAKHADRIYVGSNNVWADVDGKQDHAWSGDQTFDGTKEIAKQATGTNRENQTINWKLTVGNGTTDIAGKIVTDEWTIPADVQQIMLSDEAEFTIKLYDSFDHETKTIKVKKGSADFAKYFTETSANGFKFKVPSDEGTVTRCTVEYQTKIEREVGNGNTITVTNTARDGQGNADSGSGSLQPPPDVETPIQNIQKEGKIVGDHIHYRSTLTIPADRIGKHVFLTDRIQITQYQNDENSTLGDVDFVPSAEDVTIRAKGKNDTDYVDITTKGYTFRIVEQTWTKGLFELDFNWQEGQNAIWQWQPAEDVDLIIEYDVPLSAEVYRNGQKLGTIADVDSGYITNHIREGWNGTPAFSSIPRTKSVRKWVGDVNHTDGTIEYFIEVNGDFGNSLVGVTEPLKDRFDADLEYVNNSFTISMKVREGNYIAAHNELIVTGINPTLQGNEWTFDWNVDGATVKRKQNGTDAKFSDILNIGEGSQWYNAPYKWPNQSDGSDTYPSLTFSYKLKVRDYGEKEPNTQLTYNNTAILGHATAGATSTITTPGMLSKDMQDVDGMAKAVITANLLGRKFNNGSDVTLEDTMTNLMPVLSSIKVETRENGQWTDLNTEAWSYTYTIDNERNQEKLIFTLPDEKPIRISYDAYPKNKNADDQYEVSNKAVLKGEQEYTEEKRISVSSNSGQASGSNHFLTIRKVNGETKQALKGAKFRIERFSVAQKKWLSITPDQATQELFVSDENGNVHVTYINDEGDGTIRALMTDTLYRIIEDTPPAGFEGMDKPIYFDFENKKSREEVRQEAVNVGMTDAVTADEILSMHHEKTVEVPNEPKKINFALTKRDADGAALPGAEFKLTRLDEAGNRTDTILTAASGEAGEVRFNDLQAGRYLLEETKAPEGYMLSGKTWTVSVGTDDAITVTDENGTVAAPYAFTNRRVPDLPNVGGSGTMHYALLGLALMAASVAAAYALAKKKRGQRI